MSEENSEPLSNLSEPLRDSVKAALKRMAWLDKESSLGKRRQSPIGQPLDSQQRARNPHFKAGYEPITGCVLQEHLGGGGFGEVWSAQSPFGLVAVKFCQGDLAAPHERRRVGIELGGLRRIK